MGSSIERVGPLLLYIFGLLGPLFGAVVVTWRLAGGDAVKVLMRRGIQWRFPLRWYAVALFLVPVLIYVGIILHVGKIPNPLDYLVFPAALILGQVWVVVGEEFGWRGFALPRLQDRFGSLGAALLLGVLWTAWHLPMFFVPGSPQYTETILTAFPMSVLFITIFSILLALLYNRTNGSVLSCMLLHASVNSAAFSIQVPAGATGSNILYLPVVGLAIYLLSRPLFGRSR